MKLRPYQESLVTDTRLAMTKHKRVLMQSPTGSGKTVIFSYIVSNAISKGKRVLILAHRQELIYQISNTLKSYGIDAGIIMSKNIQDLTAQVQVASIQTLIIRDTDIKFDLIIYDECHHIKADSYLSLINKYITPDTYLLGVTATPIRSDGKGLASVFDILVKGPSVQELIDLGYLVEPKYFTYASNLNLSKVKLSFGDYNKSALAKEIKAKYIKGNLVSHWKAHALGLQTIVFAANVDHSKDIVEDYLSAGIIACHIDAKTKLKDRQLLIDKFRNKEITVLSNVGIFTEGFDVPEVSCVQLALPTKSIGLYFQMIGRSLRPGIGKTHAVILDHVSCYDTFGSVTKNINWKLKPDAIKGVGIGNINTGGCRSIDTEESSDELTLVTINNNINNAKPYKRLKLYTRSKDRWAKKLNQLIIEANDKKHLRGWVYYKFLDSYNEPTKQQLEVLASTLGYKETWVDLQYQNYSSYKWD